MGPSMIFFLSSYFVNPTAAVYFFNVIFLYCSRVCSTFECVLKHGLRQPCRPISAIDMELEKARLPPSLLEPACNFMHLKSCKLSCVSADLYAVS